MKNRINRSFDNKFQEKEPPQGHREEFEKKLDLHFPKEQYSTYRQWSIAAILVFLISLASFFYMDSTRNNRLENEILEWSEREKIYLNDIDKEWKKFVLISKDETLVKKYKKRLYDLDVSYQILTEIYNENRQDTLVLEELIKNLQLRLHFLKDIQKHILLLEQKKLQNEEVF